MVGRESDQRLAGLLRHGDRPDAHREDPAAPSDSQGDDGTGLHASQNAVQGSDRRRGRSVDRDDDVHRLELAGCVRAGNQLGNDDPGRLDGDVVAELT